jgi:hypothetical protein
MNKVIFIIPCLFLCGFGDYDSGGDVQSYINETNQSRYQPMQAIPRQCDSACLTRLSGNYCIQRDGSFGVHATILSTTDRRIVPPQYNDVRSFVPVCFRRLADRYDAWKTLNYTYISARQVIAACPQLKVCR